MKKVLFAALQLLLFFLVFFAGSFFPPFHWEHVLIAAPGVTRIFIADGLVLMFVLFLIIILIEAITRRLRTAAPWTTAALLLAAVLGLMMKFGFLTRSAF